MCTRRYYHIPDCRYEAGQPLLPYDQLEATTIDIHWKWSDGEADDDRDKVCLFVDLVEVRRVAFDLRGPCSGEPRVLRIHIPAEIQLVQNTAGYPAVRGAIPPGWISAVPQADVHTAWESQAAMRLLYETDEERWARVGEY